MSKVRLQAYVSDDAAKRINEISRVNGISISFILEQLVDLAISKTPSEKIPDQIETKIIEKAEYRPTKLTVRLAEDVRDSIEGEAQEQGVTPSTWAAKVLSVHARKSPQPLRNQRKYITWGFRQLRGLATNVNQIATAMNRGVFRGETYAPTRQEIVQLREDVSVLREALKTYAEGQYQMQSRNSETESQDA